MFSVFGRKRPANQHSDGGSGADMNDTTEVSRKSRDKVSGISAWCVMITFAYLLISTAHMAWLLTTRHILSEASPAAAIPAQPPSSRNKAVFQTVEEDAPLESVPDCDAVR